MEINRIMILFSGCFLIIWLTFKWKVPHVIWDVKSVRVCSAILALYNIVLAFFFKKDLSIILFVIDLVFYMWLNIGVFLIKLKKYKKGKIKVLQLGICSILAILALIIVCLDLNEIYSSIMLLCGTMMVISAPFQEAKLLCKNIDNNQSGR